MMCRAQWTSGAEGNLSVIGLRRTMLMRTSASQLALIDWVTLLLVMSCRTRTAPAAVDGAAAARAPASRRHSPDRHRVRGQSAGGCARGSSPPAVALASGLRAKHGTAPALRCDGCWPGSRHGGCGGTRRHGVEKEPPNEFVGSERQHLGLAVMAIVFPGEVDLAVGEPGETRVCQRDAMGIAAEIGQHLLGSGERALGIDHPCDRRSPGKENGM